MVVVPRRTQVERAPRDTLAVARRLVDLLTRCIAGHPGRAALCIACIVAPAAAQGSTERASVDSFGGESDGNSSGAAISSDGRYVAFLSAADNLVANDTNGYDDVFVHDRVLGTTTRVSVDSSGGEADDNSYAPVAISGDGRWVAFFSVSTSLIASDNNNAPDVFVHDLVTGTTERVSVDSSGAEATFGASGASISSDGRLVAFYSSSNNLVLKDTNGRSDIFVHDRTTGITERVSVSSTAAEGDGNSTNPTISADGGFVSFQSAATNLVAGDVNAAWDVFVHDRTSGATERVSVDSSGAGGNGGSYAKVGALAADGSVVVFQSDATNLVAGDTNGVGDVFIRDRGAATTARMSVDPAGAEGNGASDAPSISPDGGFVAFRSAATNLVAGDQNAVADVFVKERATGGVDRSSVSSSGVEATAFSYAPALASDGLAVVFESYAANLVTGDYNGLNDVFVHEGCLISAAWSNYGTGYTGTLGIPTFTAQSNPVLGLPLTLDLGNSYGIGMVSLLFIGLQRAQIHSTWGGDLLVVPLVTTIVTVPPTGTSLFGTVPNDGSICGVAVDLQAVESDPGATRGFSFTAGLELVLGR